MEMLSLFDTSVKKKTKITKLSKVSGDIISLCLSCDEHENIVLQFTGNSSGVHVTLLDNVAKHYVLKETPLGTLTEPISLTKVTGVLQGYDFYPWTGAVVPKTDKTEQLNTIYVGRDGDIYIFSFDEYTIRATVRYTAYYGEHTLHMEVRSAEGELLFS